MVLSPESLKINGKMQTTSSEESTVATGKRISQKYIKVKNLKQRKLPEQIASNKGRNQIITSSKSYWSVTSTGLWNGIMWGALRLR